MYGHTPLALAIAAAIFAVACDDQSTTTVPVTTGVEPGPAQVQESTEHDIELALGPAYQRVSGVGFSEASEAASGAMAIIGFEVGIPAYIPLSLGIWHTNAYRDGSSGKSSLELYYTAEPKGDGKPLPAFRISWTDAPDAPLEPEPRVPVAETTSFRAAGDQWQVYFLSWRDFDMWQARTRTQQRVLITADIRVVGLSKEAALAELQKALNSMEVPANSGTQ